MWIHSNVLTADMIRLAINLSGDSYQETGRTRRLEPMVDSIVESPSRARARKYEIKASVLDRPGATDPYANMSRLPLSYHQQRSVYSRLYLLDPDMIVGRYPSEARWSCVEEFRWSTRNQYDSCTLNPTQPHHTCRSRHRWNVYSSTARSISSRCTRCGTNVRDMRPGVVFADVASRFMHDNQPQPQPPADLDSPVHEVFDLAVPADHPLATATPDTQATDQATAQPVAQEFYPFVDAAPSRSAPEPEAPAGDEVAAARVRTILDAAETILTSNRPLTAQNRDTRTGVLRGGVEVDCNCTACRDLRDAVNNGRLIVSYAAATNMFWIHASMDAASGRIIADQRGIAAHRVTHRPLADVIPAAWRNIDANDAVHRRWCRSVEARMDGTRPEPDQGPATPTPTPTNIVSSTPITVPSPAFNWNGVARGGSSISAGTHSGGSATYSATYRPSTPREEDLPEWNPSLVAADIAASLRGGTLNLVSTRTRHVRDAWDCGAVRLTWLPDRRMVDIDCRPRVDSVYVQDSRTVTDSELARVSRAHLESTPWGRALLDARRDTYPGRLRFMGDVVTPDRFPLF